jgi:hypothetical protein
MNEFRKDGRRFAINRTDADWRWSVGDLDGGRTREGRAATKAEAAARIVAATLADVDWPAETGMTEYRRSVTDRAA